MTLDNEVVRRLKIEKDFLLARIHKIDKALEAFGAGASDSPGKRDFGKVVQCSFCKKSYTAIKVKKAGNFCSHQCTPSYRRVQATRSKPRAQILVKGDALSK